MPGIRKKNKAANIKITAEFAAKYMDPFVPTPFMSYTEMVRSLLIDYFNKQEVKKQLVK